MERSFGTVCHGAGRRLSRTVRARQVTGAELRRQLEADGIAVAAASSRGLAEEAPFAYKDVERVVGDRRARRSGRDASRSCARSASSRAEDLHETPADIEKLQALIDRSYAEAGTHLLRIHSPERRLSAEQVVERLTGMCLLTLATVTADCRPLAGPVDGIFYRGAFHFGSSPDSFRFRHIRARPYVSATHLPGEELGITVHGRAVPVDVRSEEGAGFRQALLDIYVPRYGAEWENFLDSGPVYARIEADRMFTFGMPAS